MNAKNLFIATLGIAMLAVIITVTRATLSSVHITTQAPLLTAAALNTDAKLTLLAPTSGVFQVGEDQTIRWKSENYSAPDVTISLIRKVSDEPKSFELVRIITPATANTGSYKWSPLASDVGDDLYIEIGCHISTNSCRSVIPPQHLSVVDNGDFLNTANVRDSLKKQDN